MNIITIIIIIVIFLLYKIYLCVCVYIYLFSGISRGCILSKYVFFCSLSLLLPVVRSIECEGTWNTGFRTIDCMKHKRSGRWAIFFFFWKEEGGGGGEEWEREFAERINDTYWNEMDQIEWESQITVWKEDIEIISGLLGS